MNRVRQARLSANVSQQALATAAGVSRQSIGAIEAGRHSPSVDAAIAIAAAVGRTVEELFGGAGQAAVPVLGEPAPADAPVLAARVGERVVYAPVSASISGEGWSLPNAVIAEDTLRVLPGGDLDGLVLMGCDPALGSIASMLPSAGPRRLLALSGSTGAAVTALRAGLVHGALVHERTRRLPAAPAGTIRLHLARWRVGIASRGRAREIAELSSRRTPVVQRDAGASTQKALERAGASALPGPVASGHLDVARRVAAGAAAGVTMEPAALRYGLAFSGLEEHAVELWIDPRWRGHPGVEAVGGVLRSAAFTERLRLIAGYDVAGCGVPS